MTRVTENDVESACIEYLKALGWRPDRNNRGLYYTPDGRKQMIGRKGQCDWRFVRTVDIVCLRCDRSFVDQTGKPCKLCRGSGKIVVRQYFEVEFKSPTGSVSKEQAEYIAILRHFRIPAWVVRSLDDLKVALITENYDG